jgi:hypothetical protein
MPAAPAPGLANDYLNPAGQVLAQVGQQNAWLTAQHRDAFDANQPGEPFRLPGYPAGNSWAAILANQELAGRTLIPTIQPPACG